LGQYFSNRRWDAKSSSGQSYVDLPFNPGGADLITWYFTPNNDIMMVLNTWGNTSYTIPVICQGNFAVGISQSYTYVFSFGGQVGIPG
jgi:hypothetical protein